MTQSLQDVARRWIEDGWRKGDVGVVDVLHSPDFVDHDSAGRAADNEGFKSGIRRLFAAFPDFSARVEDLVVDTGAGTVAIRWTGRGTHLGEYLGAAPSGRVTEFKGIEIIRIVGGRIVERWGEWDGIDLLTQLDRVVL